MIKIDESILQNGEKIALSLRALYAAQGYRPFRMSKFEEYDFYARNKDFLLSDHVITFTDTDGKLMAMKPDVTLSIIKNSRDLPDSVQKLFYNENVYRVSRGSGAFREIMQVGAECFGPIGSGELYEVLMLAARSMECLAEDWVLSVSDLSLSQLLMEKAGVSGEAQKALYKAMGEKNLHAIDALCPGEAGAELKTLLALSGPASDAAESLRALPEELRRTEQYRAFAALLERLAQGPFGRRIRLDFSVTGDVNYYNAVVFKGFIRGIPEPVLSGGQYDRLMQKLHRKARAVGFAVYTDLLDRGTDVPEEDDGWINIALPKGRLGEKVYTLFAAAGYECPSVLEPKRRLIFENAEKKVRYFWVKPSDVAIYVERGAADIGVAGKDILLEYEPEIYELLDLKMGNCRMAVAAPEGFEDRQQGTLRVATKFSGITQAYYRSLGREIDIIHLNGSIEIAPILGLSDVIVDIVETGATLRENHLKVIDTIVPISARLIANQSAFRFKGREIERIADSMKAVLEEKE